MPAKVKKHKSLYCQNKIKKKNGVKKNWHQIANRLLMLFVVVLGVGYIAAVNDISIKGFVLDGLKNQQIKLEGNNKHLELEIMALESYDTIDKRAHELKMVKVDKVDYITINSDDLAKK